MLCITPTYTEPKLQSGKGIKLLGALHSKKTPLRADQ